MNLGQQILMGVFIGLVVWVLTVLFQRNTRAVLVSAGIAVIIVPLIFIFSCGMLEIYNANPDNAALHKIANESTAYLTCFIGENVPDILLADAGGAAAGIGAGMLLTRRNRKLV